MAKGVGMFTSSDSEVIIQTIAQPPLSDSEKDGPNWIGVSIGDLLRAYLSVTNSE
jgi:hypothetical protein